MYSLPSIVRVFVSFLSNATAKVFAPTTFINVESEVAPVTIFVPSPPSIVTVKFPKTLNVSSPPPPFII